MTLAPVHTLYETNSRSVTDMLRMVADQIDAETDEDDRTRAGIFLQVTENDGLEVFAWGDVTTVPETAGWLQMAVHQIISGSRA